MSKTAKFRHIGPGGYVAVGFSSMTQIETDQVIEVSDCDEAVRGSHIEHANGHIEHRDPQTTADCYRNQPSLWEEVPNIEPVSIPEEGN